MASPSKDTGTTLTTREIEVLSKVWKCLKTPPEIDLPKLAQECGMTNVGSASNAWGRIKKKLFAENGIAGSSATTETPPVTPSRKRKNAASTAPSEGDASEDKDMGEGSATVPDEEDSGAAEPPTTPKRRRVPTGDGSAKAGTKRAPRTPRSAKKTPVKVEESDDGDAAIADAADKDGDQGMLVDGAI